jgi:hypothetical protein
MASEMKSRKKEKEKNADIRLFVPCKLSIVNVNVNMIKTLAQQSYYNTPFILSLAIPTPHILIPQTRRLSPTDTNQKVNHFLRPKTSNAGRRRFGIGIAARQSQKKPSFMEPRHCTYC